MAVKEKSLQGGGLGPVVGGVDHLPASSKIDCLISVVYIVMQLAPQNILVDNHQAMSIAMPGIQNFFHKVLALVFDYLYFRRKLLVSSIECYYFPVEYSKLLNFFFHTNFH